MTIDALYILGYYPLFLILFGSICNILIVITCSRLKDQITFQLLSFMAVSDIISLFHWNMNHFINNVLNIDIDDISIFWCKFSYIFQVTSLQYSAWLLVNKPLN